MRAVFVFHVSSAVRIVGLKVLKCQDTRDFQLESGNLVPKVGEGLSLGKCQNTILVRSLRSLGDLISDLRFSFKLLRWTLKSWRRLREIEFVYSTSTSPNARNMKFSVYD